MTPVRRALVSLYDLDVARSRATCIDKVTLSASLDSDGGRPTDRGQDRTVRLGLLPGPAADRGVIVCSSVPLDTYDMACHQHPRSPGRATPPVITSLLSRR